MLATTIGRPTSDSIAAAAKNDCPSTIPCEVWLRKPSSRTVNRTVPNRARTTDGSPASISTDDSATRANPVGRPNSLSHTAIPIPTGVAIAIANNPTITVPRSGSRKPPVWLSLTPGAGLVTSRFGRRYRIPSTRK